MFWKNWPYWLRGGVVGAGVTLISWALTNACTKIIVVPGYDGLGFECLPFALIWFPFWPFDVLTSLPDILYIFIGTIFWFVVGSLIGLIIGKLKSKKSPLIQ